VVGSLCLVYSNTIILSCLSSADQFGWGSTYNPFFGFKKLPKDDAYEKIFPFLLSGNNWEVRLKMGKSNFGKIMAKTILKNKKGDTENSVTP
jgi:hypothetical protein